ncbi:MAG: cytochrome b N-terminal domain-containing protein [Pseudomonadota bacterium]
MSQELPRNQIRTQPSRSGWNFRYALWGVFTLTMVSGVFLMVYYVPQFGQAFFSVGRMNEQVPFGWMMRRIHGAGGNILLILLFLYLFQVFYCGDYKASRPAAWVSGILAFGITLWINFTGFFLPLSQASFWGTATVLSNLSAIPYCGSFFVDFIRGGKELGGTSLLRFYSMHIGFSALVALLLFRHQRRASNGKMAEENECQRFQGISIAWITAALLLAAITFVPHWFSDPLQEAANPLANPERIFLPWYFLYLEETLKFLAGAYPVLSLVAITAFAFLLFSLPYIDRNPERSILLRPLSLGLGATFLVVVLYFSFLGMANARYGERIILPARTLLNSEIRGAQVYLEKNCAYCHQIFGREGRREGPDVSVIRQRKRSPEWVQHFILNPRLYQPGTTMPRYAIPLEDLEALAAYLLSLDPQKERFKAVERRRFIDYGFYHNNASDAD